MAITMKLTCKDDTSATGVDIEHLPGPLVVIHRTIPDRQRRTGLIMMASVVTILSAIAVAVGLMFRHKPAGWIPPVIVILIMAMILERVFSQFSAKTRSYVFRADETGLSIEITTWRRNTTRRLLRHQIEDIVIDGRCGIDPRHRRFNSMLVIETSPHREIHCLHDVPGDQLARVANALRTALRMPARSWP